MKKCILLMIIFSIIIVNIHAQENIPVITLEKYIDNMQSYFQNKNDRIIYETISVYENNLYMFMLDQLDNILVYFFYGIKVDNIRRYNNFKNIVNRRGVDRLIYLFDVIDNNDIGTFLSELEASAELNDIYWTLYFSSGNVQYLNNLLTVIKNYHNESNNVIFYFAARSAMWSMTLNIQTYPQVRNHFNRSNIIDNSLKDYIRNTHPEIQRNDTVEFIRQQRENGIW